MLEQFCVERFSKISSSATKKVRARNRNGLCSASGSLRGTGDVVVPSRAPIPAPAFSLSLSCSHRECGLCGLRSAASDASAPTTKSATLKPIGAPKRLPRTCCCTPGGPRLGRHLPSFLATPQIYAHSLPQSNVFTAPRRLSTLSKVSPDPVANPSIRRGALISWFLQTTPRIASECTVRS